MSEWHGHSGSIEVISNCLSALFIFFIYFQFFLCCLVNLFFCFNFGYRLSFVKFFARRPTGGEVQVVISVTTQLCRLVTHFSIGGINGTFKGKNTFIMRGWLVFFLHKTIETNKHRCMLLFLCNTNRMRISRQIFFLPILRVAAPSSSTWPQTPFYENPILCILEVKP